MKFRAMVLLDVDVDPASVTDGRSAAAVAAELARETLDQQDCAIELHRIVEEATCTVRLGGAIVSMPRQPLHSRRVTDRIAARRADVNASAGGRL